MYNRITLMGRLVSAPELNHTKAGAAVTSFTIAVDRRYKAKGERRKADFFTVVCWRANAEFVCEYFTKGSMILVDGELQTERRTDKNGNNATWYEVQAEHVSFTGERRADAPVIPEKDLDIPDDETFS